MILSYQGFVAQKSLLKRLYGEEDDLDRGQQEQSSAESKDPGRISSKDALRAKIEKKKDFSTSYCLFTVISCFKCFCCCFVSRCYARCRRRLDSHKKFHIAQKRLQKEYDIQHLIEMNRITRLLHKTQLLPRHR